MKRAMTGTGRAHEGSRLFCGRLCAWRTAFVLIAMAAGCALFAVPSQKDKESEGEALFKEDKGEAAISALEREIAAGDVTAEKYNYLGLAYYQAGDYERSIAAFESGMKIEGAARWALAYNAGNSAYALENFASAEGYYSDAYRGNGEFHAALLNRANARLEQDKLVEARDDYALYLERCPDSPQYERITALLALLDEEIRLHAILPEKLPSEVAVLQDTPDLPAEAQAVDDIYTEPKRDAPAPSEAMEREASLLHSEEKAMPLEAQAVENNAPPPVPVKQKQPEEGLLSEEAESEAMEKEAVSAPPVPKRKTNKKTESLKADDVTAPPAMPKAKKQDVPTETPDTFLEPVVE